LKAASLSADIDSTMLAGRYVANTPSACAFADSAVSRMPNAAIILFIFLGLRTSSFLGGTFERK
jgi:hypothetical protein